MGSRRTDVEAEARYVLYAELSRHPRILHMAEGVADQSGLVPNPARDRRHSDCYYDDGAMSLLPDGVALRIRVAGSSQLAVTLKEYIGRENCLHLRDELEGALTSEAVRELVRRLGHHQLGFDWSESRHVQSWQHLILARQLRPVVVLSQSRQQMLLGPTAAPDAELSLDRVGHLWPVPSLAHAVLDI